VLLRDRDSPSHSALGRFDGATKKLVPLRKIKEGVWGIRPRNKEQHCALDLLLPTTSSSSRSSARPARARRCWPSPRAAEGRRGAAVLEAAGSRPIFPLGRDVGYLPGDIEEKLNPGCSPSTTTSSS
jgi:PhoH-like ATPase